MKRVAEGYQIRLCYGCNRRGRFTIALADEDKAQRRANKLRELAALLAAQGKPAVAKDILGQCAAAKTDGDFQELARRVEDFCGTKQAKSSATTFKDIATDWTSGELHKKYPDYVKIKKSVDDDKQRLERLYDTIGNVAIDRFTLADAKRAMAALPEGRASATRRHYAQLMSKVLKMAVYPCELIDRSPLPTGFLPTSKCNKAKSFLYPSEDAQLLAAPADKVPLPFRMLYGFLSREGCRLGEALSLRWADLDLDRGVIRLDANKTDEPRAWALSQGVPEALAAYRKAQAGSSDEGAADELVFTGFDEDRVAETFRAHLRLAGVNRAELFEHNDNRRQIRVHDLRATFITLALANERTETWVQDRTGHKSSVMVNRYRRQARQANELKLGILAPLNEAISELTGSQSVQCPVQSSNNAIQNTTSQSCESVLISRGAEEESRTLKPLRATDFESPKRISVHEYAGKTHVDERQDTQNDPVRPVLWPGAGHLQAPPMDTGPGEGATFHDPVELALADALQRAAVAGAWTVVERLAGELEARRRERAQAAGVAEVVALRGPRKGAP
jgi:integrase